MPAKTFMLIDEKGTRGNLPPWSWPINANGRIGQHATEVRSMLTLAAHFDRQNDAVYQYEQTKLARSEGMLLPPPPPLPNNDARRSKAAQAKQQLATIKTRIAETVAKSLTERESLRPHDFAPEGADARKEMREYSRTLSREERMKLAAEDVSFREALAERPHYLSGMEKGDHDHVYQLDLERRHGPRLRELDNEIAAAERALELHGVLAKAIANELITVGEPAAPTDNKPPPNFELVTDTGRQLLNSGTTA
jgi:hypothetical protein